MRLGFDLVGIADVRPSDHGAFYRDWISAGRHGSMDYLAREDAVMRRLEPDVAFRSAVVVGLNYYPVAVEVAVAEREFGRGIAGAGLAGAGAGAGRECGVGVVARYAAGRDYHKVIKKKLMMLLRFIETDLGRELPLSRAYVDTGPVLERELARRAGVGWFGRNTMIVNPKRGSYFFLGSLLLDVELEYDQPFAEDHCGTCNACVTACPTGALLGRDASNAPVMDATRCISYLTIENRGPIPRELRTLMGNRIFGCDICQEVCPWNSPKFVQVTRENDFAARRDAESENLMRLMQMDEAQWDEFSRGSAIRRARRAGFLRNVAVALGNSGSEHAVPVLAAALDDAEPLVRGHAAWALAQIGGDGVDVVLSRRAAVESDAWVLEELQNALEMGTARPALLPIQS